MTRALSGLLAITVLVAGAAFAQHADKRAEFNIAPQSLDTALVEFADQANVQLAVSADRIEGMKTKGVRGAMTTEGALRTLLAETGLSFKAVGERSYSVGGAAHQGAGTTSSSEPPATKPAQVAPPPSDPTDLSPKRDEKKRQDSDKAGETLIETITVTGTHIRDAMPVGAPLTIYGREEIDRSGAATVDQFVRKVPENLASVDASAVSTNQGVGGFAQHGNNLFFGAGVNLRGMGPTATLVLFNGHRVAGSGGSGSFVDVSQFPLAALERVEVLTDGASALYGSDAVAGVVNFVARKDFEGMETSLRYGGATRGGADELAASHLAGTAWSSGNALLSLSYYDHDGLRNIDRDFIPNPLDAPAWVIPETERKSALGTIRQTLGSVTFAADVLYAERDYAGSNPIMVGVDNLYDGSQESFGAGANLERTWGAWTATLVGGFSSQRQSTQSVLVGIPDDPRSTGVDTQQTIVDLRASGTLFRTRAGPTKAAFGAGLRREELVNKVGAFPGFEGSETEYDQDVASLYGEIIVPIVESRLDVSIAGRYDDYADVGSSTNPRVGVSWSPVSGLTLRSTYGTSFRAPAPSDRVEDRLFFVVDALDPAAPDGLTTTLVNLTTGNASLRPEEGDSFTAGFNLFPATVPGLSITSTYFRVEYSDRIDFPPLIGPFEAIYEQASVLAPFIDPTPDPAEIQAIFANELVFDFNGVGPDGIEARYDHRIVNIARSTQTGLELSLRYERDTAHGDMAFFLAGYRTLDLDFQPAATAPSVALLDLVGFPVGMKVIGGVNWSFRSFASSISIQHLDAYENQLIDPRGRIDSWTTADLQLSYQTPASAGSLGGLTLALNVSNVTDEDPPFVDVAFSTASVNAGYDPANASPLGRVVSVQLAKRW